MVCSLKVPRMGALSVLSSVLQASSALNSYSMGRLVLCTPVLIILTFFFMCTNLKTIGAMRRPQSRCGKKYSYLILTALVHTWMIKLLL